MLKESGKSTSRERVSNKEECYINSKRSTTDMHILHEHLQPLVSISKFQRHTAVCDFVDLELSSG